MKTVIALILTSLSLLLTGCNTVAGVGKDVQRGGQVLEDAAKKK